MPRQKSEAGIPAGPSTVDAPITGTTDGGLRIRELRGLRYKSGEADVVRVDNPAHVDGPSWSAQFEPGYEPPVDDTPRLVVYPESIPPVARWER
jgi:hypothetical protein